MSRCFNLKRDKEKRPLVLAEAFKFGRKAKKMQFACELMPVPRQLSSNCGVGAKIEFDGDPQPLVDEEVEKIYRQDDHSGEKKYALVYSGD